MNARHLAFAAITLLSVPVSNAQHLDRKPHKEPLLDDLGKFNLHEPAKSIEFPVVIDPMDEPFAFIQKAAIPAPAAENPSAPP